MFLSVFDMFKIGVGPSSSHTIGPMVAAARFLDHLRALPFGVAGLRASLHGSLAFTGVGHATDRAVILGLAGFVAETYDAERAEAELARIHAEGTVSPDGLGTLQFVPQEHLVFDYGPPLPGHANGLILRGTDAQGDVITEVTYYSIGGGFVLTEAELAQGRDTDDGPPVPFPFHSADEMLRMARDSGLTIAQMKRRNERARHPRRDLDKGLARIWQVMTDCIDRGLASDGILPGGLNVRRRAKGIHEKLLAERGLNLTPPHTINDWMSTYAMAVNEENAAGGQVVTAPTNGAAGVVPATIRYWLDHVPGASTARIPDFLLTAAAIGGLVKFNASISGAEAGCQAEVGSAAAMAAAGLCAVLGGTPEQIENAAEIALEHHLGMTCDPVKGLVQVPCIERNGLGAIKAVSAASLALRGDGQHLVSLDVAIETMRQTGADMSEKYKETALGGLAVNVPNC
ncbi:L-serine ammonia-lyase [Ponticoccus sp. SC2-23]|uniref:L-serine ammonia-lyase n=1 Tax=Alexandriicola marinus TaxID=2081710 RepID=UPI000FD9270A|nr:L-serine ammonia-lyase [Alexandriicola marinus]MBM1219578.1 L-serine ammonia-lyase [Ponticoccus sp. SC6-9]MBM1223350.1 L-serine ammonia-lyase [Ponticoccus sp. SC6-15]MBM1229391.1 L-serine ammonia-lyase [Ponticoccus sp. SC6-38]MBM1232316.1 L-serine ammonia-lyase [Ponticoccus sp. SC6-45]MBM1237734.1 L-serine ammonia-lyase [Ponticoccus sp. SC6-49]MBM1241327.1 L-serine ammonia-lyase [Ponticoccus sp. SC2-64]MBM1245840.1 L-serine ammonia-lyase [Ponticoccus sp. SC6-42]MBM1250318.1 L-serine ammo